MKTNRFVKQVIIYFLLLTGYFVLYSVDIEHLIYPESSNEATSTINFVYQQF